MRPISILKNSPILLIFKTVPIFFSFLQFSPF